MGFALGVFGDSLDDVVLFRVLCAVTCLTWVCERSRNSNEFYLSFFVCYYFSGL